MTLFRSRGRNAIPGFAAALLTCVLCVAMASLGLARELRSADNQVFDYPTTQAVMFMDRYLRERAGNTMSIRVFPSAQLGEEEQTIEQTQRGVTDMTRVSISPLAALVPEVDVFNAPYLFRSVAHLRRIVDGPIGEEILRRFEPHGLIGLAFYDSGARSIYNSVRPVTSVGDVAGLRVRVQKSSVASRVIETLGGAPTSLPFSQVLPALRAHLIDGAENNWPSYISTEHHTAARYYTLTEHTMQPDVLFMSRKSWEAFSDDQRVLLREAARASVGFMRRRWDSWDSVVRKQAIADGVVVTTDFDRPGFEKALEALRGNILSSPAMRDLGARIEALKQDGRR